MRGWTVSVALHPDAVGDGVADVGLSESRKGVFLCFNYMISIFYRQS